MNPTGKNKIKYFEDHQIRGIPLPGKFTFPFYYEPHPLTKIAVSALQFYLETNPEFRQNFGIDSHEAGAGQGKMFGVLVVKDKLGKLGYLSAYSGNLFDGKNHPAFVPPVFDTQEENSFFLKEEKIINGINTGIREIEGNPVFLQLLQDFENSSLQSAKEIAALKEQLKNNKENRKQQRENAKAQKDIQAYAILDAELIRQSLYDKRQLRDLTNHWQFVLAELQHKITPYRERTEALKNERKQRSAALQQQLFEQYSFLNGRGERKSLQEIFSKTVFGKPPAAAGECATPRLLQYAFLHGYFPVAMAEFWWGSSPKSDIRKHKQFYPACTGKCKPILAHMLDGIPVDDNPLISISGNGSALEIVYEDEVLAVVNKPNGLRSVPGIEIPDSVYSRLKKLWDNKEPFLVHRLDMDTSGLLVVAKSQWAYKYIQKQFLQRTVNKRYRALLSGIINQNEGEIDLPLAADSFNRPRQLVCFQTGKKSITKWKTVKKYAGTTKVDFWPLTGRTHQLRMHAAHELGLNMPIVGDDLYGTAADRMCLHAAYIEFVHPETKQRISFEVEEEF